MGKERYRRGAHKVTDFKYHFVWKTKYSYSCFERRYGLAFAGHNPRDLCHQSDGGGQGQHSSESHPCFGQCPGISIAGQNNAASQGQKLLSVTAGISAAAQKVLGTASMVSGVFWGKQLGAVSETQIKQYIEDQSDDPNTFKGVG